MPQTLALAGPCHDAALFSHLSSRILLLEILKITTTSIDGRADVVVDVIVDGIVVTRSLVGRE